MKKVLIITYYWPPSGGAGVQRWLKFVKFLPETGHEAVVLTVDPKYASYPQIDESLLFEGIENVMVIRTKSFEPYSLYKKVSGMREVPYGGFANESKPTLIQRLSRYIRGNFFIPDSRRGWNKYAFKAAQDIIKKEKIEVVITTSPPHSSQLIGQKLKQKLGIKWIADFRDPWTEIYYKEELYQTFVARWLEKQYEKRVLTQADSVIVVSEDMRRIFRRVIPERKEKIKVIPNGFDHDDFTQNTNDKDLIQSGRITVTYVGTLSEQYKIDGFIEALNKLPAGIASRINLLFVGKLPDTTTEKLKMLRQEISFSTSGYVPHAQAISIMMQADILLLIIPKVENNLGILTGKLFEYLGARKPILAMGPCGGDADKLIAATKSGKMFDYEDSKGVCAFLSDLNEIKNFVTFTNTEQYSRRNLTYSLAGIINTL